MASGFGYGGGRSRCFTFWQEFSKCYAQADAPQQCKLQADDYLECLHHTKEVARAKTIHTEFVKKAKHDASEGFKAATSRAEGSVGSVGLINKDTS